MYLAIYPISPLCPFLSPLPFPISFSRLFFPHFPIPAPEIPLTLWMFWWWDIFLSTSKSSVYRELMVINHRKLKGNATDLLPLGVYGNCCSTPSSRRGEWFEMIVWMKMKMMWPEFKLLIKEFKYPATRHPSTSDTFSFQGFQISGLNILVKLINIHDLRFVMALTIVNNKTARLQ